MKTVMTSPRARTARILSRFAGQVPRLSVDRARYFTRSFRTTEHLPLVVRWAKALAHVMENIDVRILPDELIVGRGGPEGRYGILYPELEGAYFATAGSLLESAEDMPHHFSEQDIAVIRDELLPFWAGKTFRESLADAVPLHLRRLLYKDGDIYVPSFIIHETATVRHSLQWVLDYGKVLQRGFCGIYQEAARRLDALDINDPSNNWDKAPFYRAVMILCEGIRSFACRYAALARQQAAACGDTVRREELEFSGILRLPNYWREEKIAHERALELLDCLWLNMAQFVRVQPTAAGIQIYEGNAHWEHTCIGGQLADGSDATNELSWLLLRSRREFPLDYPELSLRIHEKTPEDLLQAACAAIREGRGPKFMNDVEIIDLLVRKGAGLEEARDYSGSGYSEVRLINRTTYLTGTTWFNLAAVLEMVLYDGHCSMEGSGRLGLETGDPCAFSTYAAFEEAFFAQLSFILEQVLIQQYVADTLRPAHVAAPLLSSLHDLCMEQGRDINVGRLEGALILGGQIGPTGFATVVDSLAAIRWLVYERRVLDMARLLEALRNNFEGFELERQYCLAAPKFGNQDDRVDDIAARLDRFMVEFCGRHLNYYGGTPEIFYVPVTSHRAMGGVTGATPDGRRAGDALSAGISPGAGCARNGFTAILHSVAACKYEQGLARAARMLEIPMPPRAVAGKDGCARMAAFVRTWSRQKHWHLNICMQDALQLLAARNDKEKFYAQMMPFEGYAALPGPLRPEVQAELLRDALEQDIQA